MAFWPTLGTFTRVILRSRRTAGATRRRTSPPCSPTGTVDGPWETELLWYYIIVATAGHDTTSHAFGGGMEQLLRHPGPAAPRQENPDLAANAAEEMIRWTSPVRSFFRWVQEDTELPRHVKIAKGGRRLTSYPLRQPRRQRVRGPDAFDVTRTDADKTPRSASACHTAWGPRSPGEVRAAHQGARAGGHHRAGRRARWQSAHFVSGVKHLPVTYTLR